MYNEFDNLFTNIVEEIGIDAIVSATDSRFSGLIVRAEQTGSYDSEMVVHFLRCAHLSLRNLEDGNIDYRTALRNLVGETVLPERYIAKGAFSNRITTHNMINLLTDTMGQGAVDKALRYLQTKRECFSQDKWKEKVSTEFNADLMDAVAWEMMLKDSNFYSLGQKYTDQFAGHPFAKELEHLAPKQVYEVMFDCVMKHIEQSFDYRLVSLSDKSAIVERHFTPEMQDATNSHKYSTRKVLEFSKGFASNITKLSNLAFEFPVRTLKCPYADSDSFGKFEIDLTDARQLGDRRLGLVGM